MTTRYAERLRRAEGALHDPVARARLLAPWRQPPAALDALVGELDIPDCPLVARLVAWAESEAPALPGETGAARDARIFGVAEPVPTDAPRRAAAALVLLSRIGEELDERERRAPAAQAWPTSARDAEARGAWTGLSRGDMAAAERFAALWGDTVRASFAGVAAVLRLPGRVALELAAAAREQLELAVVVAHLDLAARLVETTGEPIGALEGVLGPAGRARVEACIARRSAWARTREGLRGEGSEPSLAAGADAVVLKRLAEHLRAGRAPAHPLGLPGWGVVVTHRNRMRGRLRAAATLDPASLAGAVRSLDALYARTTVTLARYAWEWAWREARTSFGFDPERLRPPRCTLVDEAPGWAPIGAEAASGVRTFLLLVAGRGAWSDLRRWLAGEPGRTLGRTFYRCLEQLPASVAEGSYEALRAHLAAGGLDAYLPELRAAARAVATLPTGRALRAELDEALAPWWDASAIARPRHHLPGFRDGVAGLLLTAPTR